MIISGITAFKEKQNLESEITTHKPFFTGKRYRKQPQNQIYVDLIFKPCLGGYNISPRYKKTL